MGKAIARGWKKTVGVECFKDPTMARSAIGKLGTIIRQEIRKVASTNALAACSMQTFSWEWLLKQLGVHAPHLHQLLTSLTTTKGRRTNQRAVIGMCAAILMKHQNPTISLVQKILSIILYAGHASKQVILTEYMHGCFAYHLSFKIKVYTRLQRLNICMSHKTVIRDIEEMGENFDARVKRWQESLQKEFPEVDIHKHTYTRKYNNYNQ